MRKSKYAMMLITSMAVAAQAGVEFDVSQKSSSENNPIDAADYDVKQKIVAHHRDLLKGMTNSAQDIFVDEMLLASYNGDASDITEIGGCYDNCYKNCHGSRSWR